MVHYWIELAVWLLVAYAFGCLVGWFLKNLGKSPTPAATLVAAPVAAAPVMAPKVMAAPTPAPAVRAPPPVAAAPAAPATGMERPKGIAAARGGKADNLQHISGVGPKNEKILHSLGIFHFDQIAAWSAKEQHWVDDHLKFQGRIIREEWAHQAKLLAAGKDAEFEKEYGTGGLKGKDGQTHSGTRTRNTDK
jgi:predicted flap endonuclease-1-like 5' DNA nuclease